MEILAQIFRGIINGLYGITGDYGVASAYYDGAL